MITSILVALDDSKYSEAATRYALEMASIHHASLTGLAIVDTPGIEKAGAAVPLGAMHYKEHLDEQRRTELTERLEKVLMRFNDKCQKSQVAHAELEEEGTPFERIFEDSMFHDLIVVGLRTDFQYSSHNEPGETLQRLIRETVRPIIAVPDEYRPVKKILVATDFSPHALRMMYFLSHVHLFPEARVTALHVTEDLEKSKSLMERAIEFMADHGVEADYVCLKGSVREEILRYAEEHGYDMIALGSHSKKSFAELLFGNTMKHIVKNTKVPVLTFH